MKFVKKSIAVVLTLLMVFGSFSMLTASAAGIYDWEVDTRFYRMQRNADGYIVDADGNVIGDADDNLTEGSTPVWVETTRAMKGESVKARVFIKTNFPLGNFSLLHVYPTAVLAADESAYTAVAGGYAALMNSDNEKVAQYSIGGITKSGVGNTGKLNETVSEGYIDASEVEDLSWTFVAMDEGSGAFVSDGSSWIYEMNMTVIESASELGHFYILPESIADWDNFTAVSFVSAVSAEGANWNSGLQTLDDYDGEFNPPTLNDQDDNSSIGINTTLTFDAADGAFKDGTTATLTATVDPFNAATGIEEPERDGFIFTGWTATYTDTGASAADDLVATADIKVGYDDITYTANYIPAGMTATVVVNYTDVTTGAAATASKQYPTTVGNTVKIVETKPETLEENVDYILYSELPAVANYELDTANTANELELVITADGATTLNVYYKPVQYTATFDPANGDEATTYTEDYYTEITAPAAPSADGKVFKGWSDGTTTIAAGATFKLEGNVTYTAQYDAAETTVTLYPTYLDAEQDGAEATEQEMTIDTFAGYTVKVVEVKPVALEENTTYVLYSELPEIEHYTFDADNENNELEVVAASDGSSELYAWYTADSYTATFNPANGGEATTITETYYTEITAPAAPTAAAGQEFTGWKLDGTETVIAAGAKFNLEGDVSYTAQYKATDYTVTYAYAGDVPAGATAPDATTANMNATITLTAPEAVEGYTFKGWTVEGADYNAETGVVTVGTTNVTITGTWAKNYVVTYEFVGSGEYPENVPADVTAPAAATVNKGDTVVVPENPTADGFNFIEWTVEGATYDAATDSYIVGDGDVTVIGTWEAIDYTYKYYLDDEKTVLFTTKHYAYGDVPAEIDLPTDDILAAKGFEGWYADAWDIDTPTEVTGNLDFVLIKSQYEYFVEFYNMNGDAIEVTVGEDETDTGIVVVHGATVDPSIVVGDVDVIGYTATGKWHIGAEDGEIASFPYVVKEDTAFYADYEINKHDIIYYADEEGKSVYETIADVPYDTVISADHVPAGTPSKEGYTFGVWTEKETGSEIADYIGSNMPDADVYVYPSFTINQYTITWVIDGVESTTSQDYGTSINKPADPSKTGYTFKGWSTTANGAVLEDLGNVPANSDTKFYAVFAGDDHVAYTVNKYLMNTNGTYEGAEVLKETLYGIAGEKATYTPAAPIGFTFDATQANVLEGTIAGDGSLELSAYFARDKHTVTYVADGETVDTAEVYYGAAIEASDDYTTAPDGYTLLGWARTEDDDVPDYDLGKMGTEDVTLYAVLEAKTDTEYTVEIYTMGTDGKYGEPETETKTGTTDTTATYEPAVKEGFTVDASSVLSTVITADDTDVIKVYYSRNKVNVTIDGVTEEKYYGEEITAPETPEGDPGYEFDKWVDEDGNEVTFPVIVGTEDIVIEPTFKPETDTEYTVEIYTMGTDGKYGEPETETKTGTTDTTATYEPAVKEGFTVDASSVLSTVITADDTDVIKVYYSRNKVNVTIDGVTEEKYYGEEITEPTTTPEGDPGYEFDKWVDEDGNEVTFPVIVGTDPIVIEPTFKAETDTEYTIEIYTMGTDGKYGEPETETKTGTTETTVNYEPAAKEGFTVDTAASVLSTVITGDDTDVIKVYYIRNKVNVTIDDVTEEKYYGEEIPEPEKTPDAPEGEEFDKWVDEDGNEVTFPVIVGTDPIVIEPSFKPIKYTVTFIVEGMTEAYASGEFDHGTAIQKPADPTVAGYTFKGWSKTEGGEVVTDLGTVPAEDITFYAILEANTDTKYTVKKFFMNEDGSDWMAPVDDVRTGTTGDTVTLDFAKEAVEGFTIDEANSTKSAEIAGDGSTILVIYYNRNKQNVTINGVTEEKYYGEEITTPETPKAEDGYKFGGWVDEDGNPVTFPITVGTEDIVIKPVWNKLSYSLTFKGADGSIISGPTTVEYGAAITAPEIADKEGYTFIGWIAEGTGARFNGTMPATDVVYVETWNTGDVVGYKIETYIMDLNGEYQLQTWANGTATTGTTQYLTAEEIPGFTVDMTLSNLSAVVAGDGSTVLKAYYARDMYKVTFDGANEQQLYFGDAIPVVEPAAQTGKTFDKWVVEGTTDAAPATMPANDLALVSTWTDTVYTITYIVEGVVVATDKYVYGADVTAPADPEAYGKKFTGWKPAVPETMPAENLIISAIFDSAIYKVTFVDFDGNAFVEMQVRSGDAIVLPAEEPTKEFYTFEGWLDVPATMPAEDIVIKPDFERVPVVLVPEEGSTTVIDRDNMVIYGLEIFLDEALIDEYLDVEGDGHYTVTPVANGCYGTGTVIEVYDNVTGEKLETFHIVIFGDLNGDARVNAVDAAMADDESLMLTDWSEKEVYENGQLVENENYKVYMAMAADVNGKNGRIDATDVSDIRDTSLGTVVINQVTGTVER